MQINGFYPPHQPVSIPIQQVGPIIGYPQTNGTTDELEYQNYENISQIPHKLIIQKDRNTFFIPIGLIFILIIFIFFFWDLA